MRTVNVNNNQNTGLLSSLLGTYVGSVLPQMLMDNYAQRGAQKITDQAQAQAQMGNMDKARGFLQQYKDSFNYAQSDPATSLDMGNQARAGLAGLGYSGLSSSNKLEDIDKRIDELNASYTTFSDYMSRPKGKISDGTYKKAPIWNRNGLALPVQNSGVK